MHNQDDFWFTKPVRTLLAVVAICLSIYVDKLGYPTGAALLFLFFFCAFSLWPSSEKSPRKRQP